MTKCVCGHGVGVHAPACPCGCKAYEADALVAAITRQLEYLDGAEKHYGPQPNATKAQTIAAVVGRERDHYREHCAELEAEKEQAMQVALSQAKKREALEAENKRLTAKMIDHLKPTCGNVLPAACQCGRCLLEG